MQDEDFLTLHNMKMKEAKVDRLERMRPECCAHEMEGTFGDCDSMKWPKGPGHRGIIKYAETNE